MNPRPKEYCSCTLALRALEAVHFPLGQDIEGDVQNGVSLGAGTRSEHSHQPHFVAHEQC